METTVLNKNLNLSISYYQLIDLLKQLNQTERLIIFDEFKNEIFEYFETLNFELTNEQKKELDRRLFEIENGTAKLIPANEVFNEIEQILNGK